VCILEKWRVEAPPLEKGRGIKIWILRKYRLGHYENDKMNGQARAVYDNGE
jgi:hypothetical protein